MNREFPKTDEKSHFGHLRNFLPLTLLYLGFFASDGPGGFTVFYPSLIVFEKFGTDLGPKSVFFKKSDNI